MRKDYVSERFMIVSKNKKSVEGKKNPFAPGNESLTNPSVLSLVEKDGMLQRLQDSEDDYVEGLSWIHYQEQKEISLKQLPCHLF